MGYPLLSKYRSELMGCAMLWVMLFHAQDLRFGWAPLHLFANAGFGGVDVFILLSAMGIGMSLGRTQQEYTAYLRRRAGRILPAYFAVMVPYTLLLMARGEAKLSTLVWNSTLLNYWVRAEGGFNWYVSGIMLFYALLPALFALLRGSRRKELTTAAWVLGGLLLCRILIMDDQWSYLDLAYRIPVLFLGLLMGFYVLEERRLGKGDLAFWLLSAVAGGIYLVAGFRVDAEVFYLPLCHVFLFTTVPMCLVGCFLFERLPLGYLCRGLRFVGQNSLEIYLLNVSFFSHTHLLQSLMGMGQGDPVYYLITIPLNILLGVLLHRAVEPIRTGRG